MIINAKDLDGKYMVVVDPGTGEQLTTVFEADTRTCRLDSWVREGGVGNRIKTVFVQNDDDEVVKRLEVKREFRDFNLVDRRDGKVVFEARLERLKLRMEMEAPGEAQSPEA